jgi:hypothetical protein
VTVSSLVTLFDGLFAVELAYSLGVDPAQSAVRPQLRIARFSDRVPRSRDRRTRRTGVLSWSVARVCAAFVPIALMACNLFDTSGVSTGVASVGNGDTTVGTTATSESSSTAVDSSTSSSVDSGSGSSSSTSGGESGQLGPFAPPIPIFELNGKANELDPTLRGDQLEILFASDRSGVFDLFRATRRSADEPWDTPTRVDVASTFGNERSPELSVDGLVLTFASDSSGLGDLDVFVSTRASADDEWGTPSHIGELNTVQTDDSAAMSADLLEVFLCSSFSGDFELYRATRDDQSSPWTPPVALVELNTRSSDCSPFLDVSGSWLLFTSDRAGGLGNQDIWAAVRDDATAPFAALMPVAGVNGSDEDVDPWISPELDVIYLASRSGAGDFDLFMAVREQD